jgi:hypothetical protein
MIEMNPRMNQTMPAAPMSNGIAVVRRFGYGGIRTAAYVIVASDPIME